MFGLMRAWKRRKLRSQPFPGEWIAILEREVPFYSALSPAHRRRFHQQVYVFVHEKHFIGVKDMDITDEVRLVIAACAVRLSLGLDISVYDRLTEIIVYPYIYRHENGGNDAILGEAHTWGTVVLAWPAVVSGLRNSRDGHDTALHEFAHVLDRDSGAFNGTPKLRGREDYRPWAEIMSEHYFRLRKNGRLIRKVMRDYGATNEAEFFAVASESYFEKPKTMRTKTPELYQIMRRFFGRESVVESILRSEPPPGRNDPCSCGSGEKYKRCCA